MHLAPTERRQRLRTELRAYFAAVLPEGGGRRDDPAEQRRLLRRIGADSLLGLGRPVAYGGQGRGPDEQFVFFDEAYRAGAPVSMVTLNTVGPTLMKYGTEELKAYFLPRILSGDLVFAIGYSEPEAGTDLAALRTRVLRTRVLRTRVLRTRALRTRALRTRALRDGDDWVIDGQQAFTSNAQQADWIWLACRTDLDAPRHRGISIILVPTDDPGFSWTPVETVGGLTTTATYDDGVRVPAPNLVGAENDGWGLITNQLNHERVAQAAIGMQAEDFSEEALAHARTPDPATGRRRIDEPWVRARLAEAYARLAATRLLNWRLVGAVGAGAPAPGEASGVKFAGTESAVEVYRMCQEVVGEAAFLRGGSPGCSGADGGGGGAGGGGELERMNRAAQINTFGGGVSEVRREMVATMRLGMTRGRR